MPSRILFCFGLFAIATGCGDLVFGSHMLIAGGASLGSAAHDPVLDSQLRFLGAIWAGWGAMLIWALRALPERRVPLLLLSGALLLGGVGRAASAVQQGAASPLILVFIAVEFGLPLVALATAWLPHHSAVRRWR